MKNDFDFAMIDFKIIGEKILCYEVIGIDYNIHSVIERREQIILICIPRMEIEKETKMSK